MKRGRRILASSEAQALLFALFLALYVWPLLSTTGQGRPLFLYLYYYTCFAIHVAVVLAIAMCTKPQRSSPDAEDADRD